MIGGADMIQYVMCANQGFLRINISFLLFLLSISNTTLASNTPIRLGSYCPTADILLISAEELSASINLSLMANSAWLNKKPAVEVSRLISASSSMQLAASRGASSRSMLLINALVEARKGENYTQMLKWLPLLRASLLTIPDDKIVSATQQWLVQAEDIMRGKVKGNPLKPLKQARRVLACDGLDVPLQKAISAQALLLKPEDEKDKEKNYDAMLTNLRDALSFVLHASKK